jgi:hypothetical protein
MKMPATLHKADGEAIPVTVWNLSSGGAFVAFPADRATLRGLVALELGLPGEGQTCRWRALVIYQRADGAGLMFDDRRIAERQPFLAVQRAIRSAMVAGRPAQKRAGL